MTAPPRLDRWLYVALAALTGALICVVALPAPWWLARFGSVPVVAAGAVIFWRADRRADRRRDGR